MNAARSLDLLRSNLQKFINKEIDDVIQKYINVSTKTFVFFVLLLNQDHCHTDLD